jgi:hypothetical protein
MVYKPNIPLPTDNLSVSQNDLLQNFTSANTSFSIDHYSFDDLTTNNGRHKDIHIVKRVGDPVNVAGVEIVYSKDYTPDTTGGTADTQLFAMTGAGGISQLTGNSSLQEGWCWMGGVLLQWGVVAVSSGSGSSSHRQGTVTFKDRVVGASIPFPNNCFVVTTNLTISVQGATSPASNTLSIFSKSATNFTWTFNTSGNITDQPQFYWMAIGN